MKNVYFKLVDINFKSLVIENGEISFYKLILREEELIIIIIIIIMTYI